MVHLPGAHDPSVPIVFATAGPLEADDDIDMEDDDSGIDAEGSEYSSTSSLTPSLRRRRMISNREYHCNNPEYWCVLGLAVHVVIGG